MTIPWTQQDFTLFKKLNIEPSTIPPEERHQTKMCFRNERYLYKRQCDLCKKDIIAMFHPDSPYKVYCQTCWWSDNWDGAQTSQEIDFTKPFFPQLDALHKATPKAALDNFDQENSDFCNYVSRQKDCYMVFGSWHNEKTMYSNTAIESMEIFDTLYTNKCSYSYELTDCESCYELFFAQNCALCSNSYFLFDCRNCQNCIFSYNLRNKQNYIFNKPVSKEEFEETRKKILSSYESLQQAIKTYHSLVETEAVHKYMIGENNENCTGNLLYRCKNVNDMFYAIEAEDLTHSVRTAKGQKDSMFINGNSLGELMYDSIHCDYCHNSKFSHACEHLSDSEYCSICYQCEHLFGCTSLRHKKHCILNKQYDEQTYKTLRERLISHMKETGEWGFFMPMSISPFGYNETVAQEFFPITKEEALAKGAKWRDEDKQEYSEPNPENNIFSCENCKKNYKIIKQELAFYGKYNLPTPHLCFACRHMNRLFHRLPYKSFTRPCTNCKKELISSYAPDRPEKVFCENCYFKTVY